jgi:hypothetical protein
MLLALPAAARDRYVRGGCRVSSEAAAIMTNAVRPQEAGAKGKSDLMLLQLEFLARIGVALLQIQQTERVLKTCTRHVLGRLGTTWEMIEAQGEVERNKTLGQLLVELRKRINVNPEFDDVLKSFLQDRNTFIHNLSKVPHFSLESDEGMKAGLDFISKLTQRAEHVRNVLAGLVRVIGDALNRDKSHEKEIDLMDTNEM